MYFNKGVVEFVDLVEFNFFFGKVNVLLFLLVWLGVLGFVGIRFDDGGIFFSLNCLNFFGDFKLFGNFFFSFLW